MTIAISNLIHTVQTERSSNAVTKTATGIGIALTIIGIVGLITASFPMSASITSLVAGGGVTGISLFLLLAPDTTSEPTMIEGQITVNKVQDNAEGPAPIPSSEIYDTNGQPLAEDERPPISCRCTIQVNSPVEDMFVLLPSILFDNKTSYDCISFRYQGNLYEMTFVPHKSEIAPPDADSILIPNPASSSFEGEIALYKTPDDILAPVSVEGPAPIPSSEIYDTNGQPFVEDGRPPIYCHCGTTTHSSLGQHVSVLLPRVLFDDKGAGDYIAFHYQGQLYKMMLDKCPSRLD